MFAKIGSGLNRNAKKYRKKIKEQLYAVKDRVVDIYGCNIANPNEEKKYRLFLYSTFLYRIVIGNILLRKEFKITK